MPVTDDQAKHLALMASAGRPTGAPRWDPPGVYAAIRKVQNLALTDVMRAVANATDDRDLATPGAIGNPSASCWRTRNPDHQPARAPDTWDDPTDRCAICSKSRRGCEAIKHSGHTFTSIRDHNQALAERRLNVNETVRGCKTIAAEHTEETPE